MFRQLVLFTTLFAVSLVCWSVVFWFFAPYITVEIMHQLPHRGFWTYVAAGGLLLLAGILRKMLISAADVPRSVMSILLCTIGTVLFFAPIVLYVRFHSLSASPHSVNLVDSVVGLCSIAIGSTLWQMGSLAMNRFHRRLLSPAWLLSTSATETMAQDGRQPILYLRSFDKERSQLSLLFRYARFLRNRKKPGNLFLYSGVCRKLGTSDRDPFRLMLDEQILFKLFFQCIGPYIALGRPSETFERIDATAAKDFVKAKEWRAKVLEWLPQCQIVAIDAASSAVKSLSCCKFVKGRVSGRRVGVGC
ncbi:MAG: hypothetical protein GC162_14230 [Planctomycetes bacterium]|nr:hypothetical protein [Planctomycetota bacterium]